jgi:phage-related protein
LFVPCSIPRLKSPDSNNAPSQVVDLLELVRSLEVLSEKGNALREPYSRHLSDGIFELRCKVATDIVRLLYFFHEGKLIVVTNGFVKKSQKTPPKEIALAKKRRKDYLTREEH